MQNFKLREIDAISTRCQIYQRSYVNEAEKNPSVEILREKTESVSFSVEKDYVDDSKSILAEILEADVEISSSESDHEP